MSVEMVAMEATLAAMRAQFDAVLARVSTLMPQVGMDLFATPAHIPAHISPPQNLFPHSRASSGGEQREGRGCANTDHTSQMCRPQQRLLRRRLPQ